MADNKKKIETVNNAGFSLVELIVVIMILGILGGTAIVSVSQISKSNVRSCTQKLVNVLDRTRIETISKTDEVKLVISCTDEGYFAAVTVNGVAKEPVQLGNTGLSIICSRAGAEDTDIADMPGKSVEIKYSKSTGAFTGTIYEKFTVQGGSGTAGVYLVEDTGRCYVE